MTLHNWSRDALYLPHYCLSSSKRQVAKIQLFPHRIVHFLLGLYKCYSSASFSCCRSEGLDKKTRLMTDIITFGVGNSAILNQDGKMKILRHVACFYSKCLAKMKDERPAWQCFLTKTRNCKLRFALKVSNFTLKTGVACLLPSIGMLLKRGTGSGERGTGNGSLGTSCQRKPP